MLVDTNRLIDRTAQKGRQTGFHNKQTDRLAQKQTGRLARKGTVTGCHKKQTDRFSQKAGRQVG